MIASETKIHTEIILERSRFVNKKIPAVAGIFTTILASNLFFALADEHLN